MVFRVLRGDLYPFDQVGLGLKGAFWALPTGHTHYLITAYHNRLGEKDTANIPTLIYENAWRGTDIPVFNGKEVKLYPQQHIEDRLFPGTLEEQIKKVCSAKQKVLPDVHKPPALNATLTEKTERRKSLMGLADNAFKEGDYGEALPDYVRATKLTNEVEPYAAICKVYERQGKKEAAALAYLYLALLHLKSENEKALEVKVAKDAKAEATEDAKAEAAEDAEAKVETAEAALRAAMAAESSVEITELLARHLKESGNTKKAKELYQSLEVRYEDDPQKTIRNACRILVCDPNDANAWENLAKKYKAEDSKLHVFLLAYLYFREQKNQFALTDGFFLQASKADKENPLPQIVRFYLSDNLDERIELSREIAERFLMHPDIHLGHAVHYLAFARKSGEDQDYIKYIRYLKSDFHTEEQVAGVYLEWAELRENEEKQILLNTTPVTWDTDSSEPEGETSPSLVEGSAAEKSDSSGVEEEPGEADEVEDSEVKPSSMSAVQVYQKGIKGTQEPLYVYANYMRWLVTRRDPNTKFLLPELALQLNGEMVRKESPAYAKAILQEIYNIIREHGCGDETIAQLLNGDRPAILKLFSDDAVAALFQTWAERRAAPIPKEDVASSPKRTVGPSPTRIYKKGLHIIPSHLMLRLNFLKYLLEIKSEDELLKTTASYAGALLHNRKSRSEKVVSLLEKIRQLIITYGPNTDCTKPLMSDTKKLLKLYSQEEIADIYIQWGNECEQPNEKICIYKSGIASVSEVKRLRRALFDLLFTFLDPDDDKLLAEDQETAFAYGELLLKNANWLEKDLSETLKVLEKELSETLETLEESLTPNVGAALLAQGIVPDVGALAAPPEQAPEMVEVGEDSAPAQKMKEIERKKAGCLDETEDVLAKTWKIGVDPETTQKLALIYEKKGKSKEAVRTYFSIIKAARVKSEYQFILDAAERMEAIQGYDVFLTLDELHKSCDRQDTAQLWLNNENERKRLEALERGRDTPTPGIFRRAVNFVWGTK